MGDKFRAIVGPYVFWRTAQDEQLGQGVDGVKLAFDAKHHSLLRELIDDVEDAKQPPIMRPILNEIIGLDMVWAFGPQTGTGPVIQPEPSHLGFPWDFQTLPPPDPLYALVIFTPAAVVQHPGGHAISVAPELSR